MIEFTGDAQPSKYPIDIIILLKDGCTGTMAVDNKALADVLTLGNGSLIIVKGIYIFHILKGKTGHECFVTIIEKETVPIDILLLIITNHDTIMVMAIIVLDHVLMSFWYSFFVQNPISTPF